MKSFEDRVSELSQKGVQNLADMQAKKKVSAIMRDFLGLNHPLKNKSNWQVILESIRDIAADCDDADIRRKAVADMVRIAAADDESSTNNSNAPIGPLTININGVKPDDAIETVTIVAK